MPKLEISKVHDAYALGGECPVCTLMDWAESTYVESFQGSRVMEPAVRVRTNETGFCPDHFRKLYRGGNKLGLGLMTHTHLQKKLPELRAALESAIRPAGQTSSKLDSLAVFLAGFRDRCLICDMLASDRDRYAFTILYLWKGDLEFADTFRASRGFCVSHFLDVLGKGREMLGGKELARFLGELVPIMTESLQRLEREVYGFTQLHKDSNRSLGTEEERTSLARTLQKLAGCTMGSSA